MKIVILDGYALNPGDLDWNVLREFGEVVVYDRTKKEDAIERLADADAAITNKFPFDKNLIESLPKLKFIAVTATGYDIIDCKAAREAGVTVTNIPAYSTDSVAQTVFAFILNIMNGVQHFTDENRNGRWSRCEDFCYWDSTLHELTGKSIGIIGMGHIGQRVAQIANAFGMKVLAKTSKDKDLLPEYVEKASLEDIFREADIISLHCPLTPDTRNMIDEASIRMMRPSTIVINTSRGPLVNEKAMAKALEEGKVAAYATDVMEHEPPSADCPLLKAPNCFITPHVAWATYEARVRLMDILVENFRAFLQGTPINVVNK
ncbi:MAG: D-2-hydroxyacid dehydrogenase [Prevotella sp.]|nr:D-2-hydroxyacid dehydrogenase [Candidatus Equicola stercoris]